MGCYLSWGSLPLIICVFPAVLLLCSHGCFVEERAALMDIRSSLMSANSMVMLDSWGRGDDCCSWERVVCNNSTRRISRLCLSDLMPTATWYLNFTVFSAFHELQFLDLSWNDNSLISLEGSVVLTKLRYLDLSGSMLGGSILSFISKFHSLEVLALNLNNITGDLPPSAFENLRNLRELNMSTNGLSGSLPASLFVLPHLKVLDLSENSFTGSIPISSSSGPTALEILNLRLNSISGPLPMTALKNIRTLYLGSNKFNGSFPASLFSLPHLKFLDLSWNSYQGHIPASSPLEPVPLQVLDPHNNLTSVLPTKQVFQYLLDLKELDLSNNEFSGNLPTFLFSLPNIELLDLSRNLLEGPILIHSRSNFSLSLKILRFARNNLSGRFSFMWLSKLTKLQEIDFSGNANLVVDINIPGWIPPFQLKQLSLSGCDIDKNIIAEPHFLLTQHQLVVLNLSGNSMLGRMPNWLFTKESTLVDLDLGNNLLTGSFGPVQFRQNFLQTIKLSMNHIEGHIPGNISSMFPALFVLDVSDNDITGHIPTSLCEISLMQYLDLSNNKFSGEVPSCMFTDYSMLSVLNLSNNKLSGPIFGGVNKLSIMFELRMNSNKFEGMIPRNLSGTTRVIDLHDNELSGKLDSSFWNLSSLIVLNLASNSLSGELHPQICSLSRIRLLDLSNNNLTGSFPECNSKWMLHFLNLSRHSLSGDFSNVLYNTSSLITLDIRYNVTP